jgi:Ni/Co efflux regulator RcnB
MRDHAARVNFLAIVKTRDRPRIFDETRLSRAILSWRREAGAKSCNRARLRGGKEKETERERERHREKERTYTYVHVGTSNFRRGITSPQGLRRGRVVTAA